MNKENDELVEILVQQGYLKNSRIIEAMKKVDRANFVLERLKDSAYHDNPLPIGSGQTISAPSMVAIMTEALNPMEGDKVLEVGAGSGYQAAIIAELVGENGFVYTIERLEEVAGFATKNLSKYKNVRVIIEDGTCGYSPEAPYDKIMVTAAAPRIPEPLIEQLKKKGVLAIPVGSGVYQEFVLVTKEKELKKEYVCGCVFVPLVGKHGWSES